MKINRVLLAGGTHGNELTGAFLIKKFERFPQLIPRYSFKIQTLLSNPKAFAAGVRYIDQDLNRSFGQGFSGEGDLIAYEELRAQEIQQLFGTQGKTPADFIIDLHSTTANMGLTLIIDTEDTFTLQLVAYLSLVHPSIKVYDSGNSGRSQDSLRSLSRFGLAIEVGPIAQGVLAAEFFLQTEALIFSILDYLEKVNHGEVPSLEQQLTTYRYVKAIDYPRNTSGEIQAMIHPQLQFKDYQPLSPGNPLFLSFDGNIINYEEPSTVYPLFINEAAYYEKGIAMCFTDKQQVQVSS
ncbi:MAG: aspartoacylase [Symploca sp. SIO3E6]|nr:aspartoacylase [Caldora sp. SIO3E6]